MSTERAELDELERIEHVMVMLNTGRSSLSRRERHPNPAARSRDNRALP
jgi:hypothetical protein